MSKTIKVLRKVLEKNERQAELIRKMLFENKAIAVNIMGSPGAGKTTLIECLINELSDEFKIGILEGDYQGTVDAERLSKYNLPIVQLNVESCHLNADFVAGGLKNLPLNELDIVLIENVGNLICPAEFDIGDTLKILVYSVAEGDDKPMKYPLMFKKSNVVVISKIDLADRIEFDFKEVRKTLKKLNPEIKIFEFSRYYPDSVKPVANEIKQLKLCFD